MVQASPIVPFLLPAGIYPYRITSGLCSKIGIDTYFGIVGCGRCYQGVGCVGGAGIIAACQQPNGQPTDKKNSCHTRNLNGVSIDLLLQFFCQGKTMF